MKSLFLSITLLVANALFAQESETPKDTIKKKVEVLDEVKVSTKKQLIKVESDKTTVSIKDNAMLSTGTAYDAVKKLPGVIASPTGGLTLNGKGVAIYIDGSPSTLSGSDLENYLSSLPANAIEKVELIYNPGAAFDANARRVVARVTSITDKPARSAVAKRRTT